MSPIVSRRRLNDREPQRVLQPLPRHVVADIETDHRWQTGQERLTEVSIAGEIPANELGHRAAATGRQRLKATCEKARKGVGHVDRRGVPPIADPVGMAMRQGDEVTSGKIDGVAVIDFATRAALAQQVIDDHVGAVASDERREHRGLGCQYAPRLRELAVQIDRRIDLDGAKHFGKRVHNRSLLPGFG